MKLSQRIEHVIKMIPKCKVLADIGTDHGYIPIYTVSNGICKKAIATDINKGPIEVASKNIREHRLTRDIETRIGSGLSVLKIGEADVIVIAGMGGNLIADIINNDFKTAQNASYLVLQPVQYPEALRRYLISNEFDIIDEDLVKDENKYYHIIKAVKGETKPFIRDVYYYTGLKLIERKHELLGEYIDYNINKINIIMGKIDNKIQTERYNELLELKRQFKDVLRCL